MRLRRVALLGSLILAGAIGTAATADRSIVPRGSVGESRAAFTLVTPAPTWSEAESGFRHISIAGFGTVERRPGAPDVPIKTVLVAIPPGSVPRLTVRALDEHVMGGIVPRPVPRRVIDADPGSPVRVRREFRAAPAAYAPAALPERPAAWLGRIGVLREQRYVEVHLAPVRYDPTAGGLRVAARLEVTVEFEGGFPPAAPRFDPRFEPVYRAAFVNYAQGTTFRLGAETPSPVSAATAAGTQAGGPRYRIRIRHNGVERLTYTRMTGTGFLAEPLSTWKLSDRGEEVPLDVFDGNGNDLLDPGEWVQFYGQALDDEPKTVFNTDRTPPASDIYEAADFSDENVYFLTVEAGPRVRMAGTDATPLNATTAPTDFESVTRLEVDDAWRPLGGEDPWSWSPTLTDNATATRTDAVALPGLASSTADLHVLVHVKGTTESSTVTPDHHTRVTLLNGTNQTLATNDDDGSFDGRVTYLHDFTWTYPGSGPTASDPVRVRLEALPIASGHHSVILDWIEVRYRRTFQASGDVLTFDWPDEDVEFEVSGLGTATPAIYELTGRVNGSGVIDAVRLIGATASGTGPFTVRFHVANDPALADGTPRRFVVAGDAAAAVPADPDFSADTVSDLRDNLTQADLVVIANPTILNDAAGSPLRQLLDLRATQGITSKIARLDDVEDEFNDGLSGPSAIRNFLGWVMSTNPGEGWADPKPSWVLLLGDGSYDFKGGAAAGDLTPTEILFDDDPQLGYYASDNLLAAVVGGDSLADLVVGRIPTRTLADTDAVLQKVLDYEQAPPPGNWTRHALFISDRGKKNGSGVIDPGESLGFEQTNATAAAFMKTPPHTTRFLRYYSDYCNLDTNLCDSTSMTQDVKDAVDGVDAVSGADGAALTQFVGHSNFQVWSDDRIWDQGDTRLDVYDLTNQGRLPWLLAHNCLSGGFHTKLARANGEDWLTYAGGGAVAVFSPSGLSFSFLGQTVSDVVWNDLFGPKKIRTLDLPVLDALVQLCAQGSIEGCQNYVLLGDPTTRLVLPSVAPPTSPSAVGGNVLVDLAWTASATSGATYDVYRSTNPPAVPYAKVNAAPVSATTYADTDVRNTQTYYYYIVALDADGFESAWSNFNSDCDVDGPDCLKAVPLNPNPPAPPQGVVVTDPESGGVLDVVWDPNAESDLKEYDVHWGVDPGVYTSSGSAAKATSYRITGLENGTTYYVAVTATNTSGKASDYSAEKSGVPTFVRGLRAPEFISDLTLAKSGSDAALSWTAVVDDIYGGPEAVARYEVYRGTTPDFVPGPATKIGETTATAFTDVGALAGGTPRYHYLVRAVDIDGNPGGLGRELPAGIDAMTLGRSSTTPGNLVLSWGAVTTDVHGAATSIDHYEVYAASVPFTRADVRDGTVPSIATTSVTTIEIVPAAGNRYYSVLAVDSRGNVSPY